MALCSAILLPQNLGLNTNSLSEDFSPASPPPKEALEAQGNCRQPHRSKLASRRPRGRRPGGEELHLCGKTAIMGAFQPPKKAIFRGDVSVRIPLTPSECTEDRSTSQNASEAFTRVDSSGEMYGWSGELGSGLYYLIPFTTGCWLKKEKKHITEEAKLVCRGEKGELFLTKKFRSALSDIFDIIDLDGNGLISLDEYNFFELRTSGEKCDEDAWSICKENFDTKKNELTKQGFMDLNLMEANDREGDPSDLWVTLQSMGYNKALEMVEACPFVIDIYTEKCRPRIKAVHLGSGGLPFEKALCQSVIDKGDAKAMDSQENVFLHTYKSDFRITSVLENKSENKVVIHVNNELSKNCVNNRSLSIFAVELAPKSTTVCQHVMPMNERQEWVYNCVYSLVS
ncbi:EF-hand calcium-binding domain-containing protein 7 isoform X2 [Vombatus ursinus]|uniref:EF-hand calcium-binding domain-containing protein 7 isoform X2 n=1 Tax=Vombatus ursinus TaxID=29139 RepID=UPI000FFD239A|nr:EF-hand calcium-binding domain-containing protein 7 isoform X2 [Vombatus ursinus]